MPYLPDDLLLNCLARVSRLYYPTLSLVSKRFRSLIASLDLYETRKLLGRTEICLYVCLSFNPGSNPRWFTLCRRPTRIPNPNPNSRWFTPCFRPYRIIEKKSSGNLMVPVPTNNFSPQLAWSRIAIGSNIYMIGTYIDLAFSSRVCFMDCRSHTWHEAPSMRTARKHPIVSVLDGKIYVVDRNEHPDCLNLIEFFDPKTQIWDLVPSPSAEIRMETLYKSLAIEGKLYLFGDKNVVYNSKENKWDVVGLDGRLGYASDHSSCVIDNVIYCYIMPMLQWYDSEVRCWRDLKGLEELPNLPKRYNRTRLVNYGGKIAVLWEEKKVCAIGSSTKKMIWCAVIAVERRNEQEVYGKIEWCDVVLTVPKSCILLQFLAVNV